MFKKLTIMALSIAALILILSFTIGRPNQVNLPEPHQYGEVVGVLANHGLTNDCFVDLVWIANDIDWDAERGSGGYDFTINTGMRENDGNFESAQPPGQGDHSVTNIQVEGVLEGDIVQVDGSHIYFLSHTGLTIIYAGRTMSVLYRDDFENFLPDEMFIFGDLLIVIGGYFSSISMTPSFADGQRWSGSRLNTVIKLYDITDRNNVARLERHSISGRFITSRLIGDQLVVLANHQVNRWNKATLLPIVNGEPINLAYVHMHMHDLESLNNHIVLASLNLNTRELLVASHFGIQIGWSGSAQYFSASYVYFFHGITTQINERGDLTRYTYLKKISLQSLLLVAETSFEGHVNDRFWVSEHLGYLRVFSEAFTSGRGNLGRHTNLFVFDETLNLVAQKSPIAIGQTIHAVRFRGNIAAIDTYILIHIRIDSVSRVDLSDFDNIVVTDGEPEHGVNEYLHFITDDIIIGLGFDTQTDNRFTSFRGIKVTLYENVDGSFEIINSFTLGLENGASSEAITNPKAILADPARNMFSIPILMRGRQVSGGFSLDGQGLAVFQYVICPDGNHEFIYRGLLTNLPRNHVFTWDNWAYHSLSFVQRGVRIGDRIYTISDRFITSYCANTLNQIQRLTLTLNVCSILGCDFGPTTVVRATTCQTDGLFRARCRRCGRIREWTEPAWGMNNFTPWVVTVVPSLTSPGQETRQCRGNCGTVERRNLVNHSFINGLLLRYDDELEGYAVRAYMGQELNVLIPDYHNGIPIVAIDNHAFNVQDNVNVSISIRSVEIGANVRQIGDNAFGGWRANNALHELSTVRFANDSQLVEIGAGAFSRTRIGAINLPDGLISIGASAFSSTGLTSIILPNSLEVIGSHAFASTPLTSIHIPASVRIIGHSAFSGSGVATGQLSALASVSFAPNSQLEEIGASAFFNTSITSVVIPASVITIGASAFAPGRDAVSRLTSLIFESGSQLKMIGIDAFARTRISQVVIPASVQVIDSRAFGDNSALNQVIFEQESQLTHIGSVAFSNTNLTGIILPDLLEDIGFGAFSNTNLGSIIIPKNTISIGSRAFASANLNQAFISASVTSIGFGAFASNPQLANLNIDALNQYYHLSENAIIRTNSHILVAGSNQARIADYVLVIEDEALHNMGLTGQLVIPTSVVEIRNDALSSNPGLTSIYIVSGSNLEIIFANAFANNTGVLSFNLQNARNLINIRARAFAQMTGIDVLIIPDNVWSVSPFALEGWLSSQTVWVETATNTLEATIRLGVNWMAGSEFEVVYMGSLILATPT